MYTIRSYSETKTIGVTRASVSCIGGRGGDENNKYDIRDAWTRITTRSIELIESIRRVGPSWIDGKCTSSFPRSRGHTPACPTRDTPSMIPLIPFINTRRPLPPPLLRRDDAIPTLHRNVDRSFSQPVTRPTRSCAPLPSSIFVRRLR